MKVMVVDDDVVSRMVLMHLIDGCGKFEIVEAEDGADAWQQLAAGLRPAICFCDLRMPHMSGLELLQRVKGRADTAGMPFVLVTSANDQDTLSEAIRLGVASYIVKPFQPEQVRRELLGFIVPATDDCAFAAEAPAATLQRLGINAERLLVYLEGFQQQLGAASAELAALLAGGERHQALTRLDRLHAGCVTLGLFGAAEALKSAAAGALDHDAVQVLLAQVMADVAVRAKLLRCRSPAEPG